MEDVLLFRTPEVSWCNKKHNSFYSAVTFGAVKLICFTKIPPIGRKHIEDYLEYIIEHESIHILLTSMIGDSNSHKFDNLFPTVKDLREFMNERD